MYCKKCGKQISELDEYCEYCGEKVVDDDFDISNIDLERLGIKFPDFNIDEVSENAQKAYEQDGVLRPLFSQEEDTLIQPEEKEEEIAFNNLDNEKDYDDNEEDDYYYEEEKHAPRSLIPYVVTALIIAVICTIMVNMSIKMGQSAMSKIKLTDFEGVNITLTDDSATSEDLIEE